MNPKQQACAKRAIVTKNKRIEALRCYFIENGLPSTASLMERIKTEVKT